MISADARTPRTRDPNGRRRSDFQYLACTDLTVALKAVTIKTCPVPGASP
jgi:hypothetical protein